MTEDNNIIEEDIDFDEEVKEALKNKVEAEPYAPPKKKPKEKKQAGLEDASKTMSIPELLEVVLYNLNNFADLNYINQLNILLEDSDYGQYASLLDDITAYYNRNKIFPSKDYWNSKSEIKEESTEVPWMLEYAHELIARLKTEVVYNKVGEILKTGVKKDIVQVIQDAIIKYVPEKTNKNFDESDVAQSLRDVLKKKKERGAGLLTYTSIDKYTYGLPFGATTVIGAPPKTGKALKNDTKLLTPTGTLEIGKAKVGDLVLGMDGKPTKITAVFPQGEKELYKVTFCDNTYEICCKEHLWLVHSREDRLKHRDWRVLDTETIMQKIKLSDRYNYSIPFTTSLEFQDKEKNLPIAPYILGCLLGDGNLCSDNICITNCDIDIIQRFEQSLPKEYYLKQRKDPKDFGINKKDKLNTKVLSFRKYLEIYLPEVLNKTAKDKSIPKQYLYTSVENRIELLKGLMDTDGSVTKTKGRSPYSYWTTSPQLRDDIIFLIKSLGGHTTCRTKPTICSYKGQKIKCTDTFEIRFNFPKDTQLIPLTCNRKLENFTPKVPRVQEKTIIGIEYFGKAEATCIMVDNESHTYLTENFNVTHNSSISMSITWGAITKQEKKGIYISLEISAETIYQRLFSRYLYDKGIYVDNKDLIKGTLSEKDNKIFEEHIDDFAQLLKGRLCVVTQENLPELSKLELEAFLLRKDAEMGGIDFIVVDQVSLLKYFTGISTSEYGGSSSNKTFDIINAYVRYFTVASYTLFQKPVAMILLSQVKRDEYKTIEKRKPLGLEIFAEASEIERSTNVAIALRADDQLKASNLIEMVLLLNRDGDNCTEYTPNVFIPKHCYLGSLGNEDATMDINHEEPNNNSLFNFMEENGEDENLDDLFS